MSKLFLFLVLLKLISVNADENKVENSTAKEQRRLSKLFSPFQLIKFENDVCTGTSRNGTCYLTEECESRGGIGQGSCASGFGVCCVFEASSCGSSSSDNLTYLIYTGSSSISGPCNYKICPCNTNICRIRYDFTKFVIASQETATSSTTTRLDGSAAGSCLTDSFSITSPGNMGTPTICGTNTGYHMILDADSTTCQKATFNIGPSTSTSRSWEIKVTQYGCGNEDRAGPDGCLQYYTGTYGIIANYGWPPSITATTSTTTHLKNQEYEACIRRESGYCYICYSTKISSTSTSTTTQNSFGVSISPSGTIAQSATGTSCSTDYITIPNGNSATIAASSSVIAGTTRFCGRFFHYTTAQASATTVCSKEYPFRIGVKFNDNEEISGTTAATNDKTLVPSGVLGFKLEWWQNSC